MDDLRIRSHKTHQTIIDSMAELSDSSIIALSSVLGIFGLLITCGVAGYCRRKYVYTKRTYVNGTKPPRAVPSAYIDPEKQYVTNGYPSSPDTVNLNIPQPEIGIESSTQPEQPKENETKQEPVPAPTVPKPNSYVKKAKHKKGFADHVVQRESSYKLYDPELLVQRNNSFKILDESRHSGRARSYIQYEGARPEYVVRQRGYKMHEPRYQARRVAHTYGTWRHQPEIVNARPIMELNSGRPISETLTTRARPVRIVQSVPPMPIRTVRPQTVGRPVIVRRTVETERPYNTPVHGYIPRHRLGQYRPKVIDGYVAPSRIGENVYPLSEPGGYRDVLIEPVYQTIKKIPPPPYPGKAYEREKVPVEKIEIEKITKRQSGSAKNFILKPQVPQTDDEKLKDIPTTQYFDDGKTIMIIDYLMDPFTTKVNKLPQSTPRDINHNGDMLNGHNSGGDLNGHKSDGDLNGHNSDGYLNGHNSDGELNGHNSDGESEDLNDSHNRQRSADFGDVLFLP
ncbi:uncharacterized protein LOC127708854 isoform X1 [Mytilus californianus]|uniref:uncharacterized protein LOC127708854 isoform X1 n=2 Tax=Mytilus californianus TaxID=6549 RepID=UPI0022476806|nr:uncharacterized protein LOC127708854 isoform X1 [Mytilus californianus]